MESHVTVPTPMFDGREMRLLHDVFRRELGLAPMAVERVAAGDRDRAERVGGHIAAVTALLHHHHAGEDEHIWPLLVHRCPDEPTGVLVALMESQHGAVDDLGERVRDALDAWVADPTAERRAALATTLRRLLPVLEEHLQTEERFVVPLMERHVTAAENAEGVRKAGAGADPAAIPLWFGMLMYEGDPEVVEAAMAGLPPAIRPTVRDSAPRAYAEHARSVHGTAHPPRSTDLRAAAETN
jgi:iron-sulfur cluster repair protein YtfE (RIC family)